MKKSTEGKKKSDSSPYQKANFSQIHNLPVFHRIRSPLSTFCKIIPLACAILASFQAYAQSGENAFKSENKEQSKFYEPEFRAGEFISVLLSGEFFHWNVTQHSGQPAEEQISPVSASGKAVGLFVRFNYHINLLSHFGVFIGSSAGVLYDGNKSYGSFTPGVGYLFPTATAGLEVNISRKINLSAGAEYGAMWYPQMKIKTDLGATRALSPVPDMFSLFAGLDYFMGQSQAISIVGGWRFIQTTSLGDTNSNIYLNTLTIENTTYFGQFRYVWNLSDL